jgi:hypothetical protein
MPKEQSNMCCDWQKIMPMKIMCLGLILFLIGIIRYYGYDWNIVLMVVGIVLFLKGIMLKFKFKMKK